MYSSTSEGKFPEIADIAFANHALIQDFGRNEPVRQAPDPTGDLRLRRLRLPVQLRRQSERLGRSLNCPWPYGQERLRGWLH